MNDEVALAAHRVARRFTEWRQLSEGSAHMQRVAAAWSELLQADEKFRAIVGEFAELEGGCGCPDDEVENE